MLKYGTSHNHPQPPKTIQNHSQISKKPATTNHNHPQPPKKPHPTHNHPQPAKSYLKKPKFATNSYVTAL